MKKRVYIGMIVSMLLAFMICFPEITRASESIIANNEEGIPDEHLYSRLLESADANADGKLSRKEAETITYFEATGLSISNLQGIQYCRNLERLYLSENDIVNIEPLEELSKLEYLSLEKNEIEDVLPLAKLTKLKMLALAENNISDINALAELSDLKVLRLWGNHIEDIRVFQHLMNMLKP